MVRGTVVLIVVALTVLQIEHSYGLSCLPCHELECSDPVDCSYGLVKDVCYCCNVCAKGPGEECGGPWGIQGKCGEGYICDTTGNPQDPYAGHIANFREGVCTEDVPVVKAPLSVISRPRGGGTSGLFGGSRAGKAKKLATVHTYQVSGSNIPPEIRALLARNKPRGKRSPLYKTSGRSGSAKLTATKHSHKAYSGIPAEIAELLKLHRGRLGKPRNSLNPRRSLTGTRRLE